MCVEDDDTVKMGGNLLEYTNGEFLTAPYDLVVISHSVPETENKCTSSNYIEVSNLSTLVTTISINENEINDAHVGQEAQIILTADESKTYTGKVTKYVEIASNNVLSVTINVDESNINKVNVGKEAKINITTLEKEYTGYVTNVASIASKGEFKVTIEFENDGNIKLGMTASIEMTL